MRSSGAKTKRAVVEEGLQQAEAVETVGGDSTTPELLGAIWGFTRALHEPAKIIAIAWRMQYSLITELS